MDQDQDQDQDYGHAQPFFFAARALQDGIRNPESGIRNLDPVVLLQGAISYEDEG